MADHPLRTSLDAVAGATGWLRVLDHVPAHAGWAGCGDLLAHDGRDLARWVDATRDVLADTEGAEPPPVVPATYVMGWYLQAPATVGALLLHRTRRVPDLRPEDLAVHRAPYGYVDAVAVTGRTFACLPDDPDAGHPDARPVADDHALAATLRERVVAHAEAFHAVFRPAVRIGSRQRWGTVLDVLDTALWQAGQAAHDEPSGVAAALRVLDGPHPPLPGGSRLRPVLTTGDGAPVPEAGWTRRRVSCCFMYALPSGDVCTTCPRLTPRPTPRQRRSPAPARQH
ncbi:(2Fe-2S)-binding protein [Thalassiella azotivora]